MIEFLLRNKDLSGEIIEAEDAWGRTALQIAEEESKKTAMPNHIWPTPQAPLQASNPWAVVVQSMQQLEGWALGERERRHDEGEQFLGPAAKPEVRETFPPAKPVVITRPRGTGLGFVGTIIDFWVDEKREFHRMRKAGMDFLLYEFSPDDIMKYPNAMTAAFAQNNGQPNSNQAYPSQAIPPTLSTGPSTEEYHIPKLRWIHLPANNVGICIMLYWPPFTDFDRWPGSRYTFLGM
jgi:hypothetical protein